MGMLRDGVTVKPAVHAGWKAVELASRTIRAVVVPELGAKIVSLRYLPTGKEWLIDPGARALRKPDYGSAFAEADMSGWDECFPTIDACAYPADGAYAGRPLPDHGELWSLPWSADLQEGSLVCTVAGRALPYAFKRRMFFAADGTLRLEYTVENRGAEPLAALWTAHPQFRVTEHTRIRLPRSVDRLLCVYGGRTMKAGKRHAWPEGLDRIGPAERRDSRKLYVDGPVDRGFAGLYEGDDGEYLSMEWAPEELPYLGVWIDEGGFNDRAVCALEPSNGFYDKLSDAAARGMTLRIPPDGAAAWRLDVRLGRGSPGELGDG
ncbi:hypothetical protein FE782_01490 [Paenibacillus antri]|uniref:DUF5107 domain-containing protein n=1 Tax=Paenibacillus antri TaxID=2582848 RepID=A0A5R9GID5_9BACL|nr:hypothetical protein [Paenibacillus antri]TLS54050.1 hypothetical protein FE782_01490 [Paenibacillus antri]